jgi:hypothetical protein
MKEATSHMFNANHVTPLFAARSRVRALETWRAASQLVGERWKLFLAADRDSRSFMFAAYNAALDREAAAADDLARISLQHAA